MVRGFGVLGLGVLFEAELGPYGFELVGLLQASWFGPNS